MLANMDLVRRLFMLKEAHRCELPVCKLVMMPADSPLVGLSARYPITLQKVNSWMSYRPIHKDDFMYMAKTYPAITTKYLHLLGVSLFCYRESCSVVTFVQVDCSQVALP